VPAVTILSVIWAKSRFCSYACLNFAGPSAKGIYFSQGFAKNQIPSAIATPSHDILTRNVNYTGFSRPRYHRKIFENTKLWQGLPKYGFGQKGVYLAKNF